MENKVISQKEYLKKYLSGKSDDKKKKKKKKPKFGQQTVKIIDDDIDLKNMRPIEENEFDILLDSEDAPQIAGIVDERGPVDFSDKRRWKIIAKDEDGDIQISSIEKGNKQNDTINIKGAANNSKMVQDTDNDLDLPRVQRLSDHDLSPPRASHVNRSKSKHSNSHSSSISRDCGGSDSDLSPPRPSKPIDSDPSPPRRKNYDINRRSPERSGKNKNLSSHKQRINHEDSDLSPPRLEKHYDSDLSPPRISDKTRSSDSRSNRHSRKRRSSTSPYARSHKDTPNSIRSRRDKSDSYRKSKSCKDSYGRHENRRSSDKSPLRKRSYESRNRSTSRKSKESSKEFNDKVRGNYNKSKTESHEKHVSTSSASSRKKSRWDSESESNEEPSRHDKRMKKTLDGKTAGLQDAKALREETEEHKKREAEQFRKLSKEVSGVGQATIIRDRKTGKKRDLEAEAAEERQKQQRQAELDEKYSVWGKGVKQVEDREEKLKDDLYEMSKPLARYADDADLDRALREQDREGDPMLEYIKQKQIKEGKRKPDQPRYEGTFMPNRFGIKPGHRWDGVDRSNGYEKKWFDAQNAKVARQEEAYKWSTSDM